MDLDLQRPTVVITGQWNPAIFEPNWTAKHLLGMQPGTDVLITQVLIGNKITNYFGEVGLSVLDTRVEFYLNKFDAENQARLEKLVLGVAATLPHTPVQALGVNFHFSESDVSAILVDMLKTHEQLESRFEVSAQSIVSVMKTEGAELNLRRDLSGPNLAFVFNYHHLLPGGVNDVATIAKGAVAKLYKAAVALIADVYSLDTESVKFVGHDFPASPV